MDDRALMRIIGGRDRFSTPPRRHTLPESPSRRVFKAPPLPESWFAERLEPPEAMMHAMVPSGTHVVVPAPTETPPLGRTRRTFKEPKTVQAQPQMQNIDI